MGVMSLFEIKKLLHPQRNVMPEDDFRIIDSWTEYEENSSKNPQKRTLMFICYELETMNPDTGEISRFFKAVRLARVDRIPASAKQSTSLMDMHKQVLDAVYSNGINLITVIANILKPRALGTLFLYGTQGTARTLAEAKQQAELDFDAFIHAMQGTYKVLELRVIVAEESEWLREKMFVMDYLTVVRGIPKASRSGEDAGNKGVGGKNVNPDSQGTIEEMMVGMADYEYVIEILSTPVYQDTLVGWQNRTQRDMTAWYGQLQGTKGLSMNLSIPMMYMANASQASGWNKSYTDAKTVSYGTGENFSLSNGQSVGESLSQNFGHSVTHNSSQSVTNSVSHGTSNTQGVTYTQGVTNTEGITNTQGTTNTHGMTSTEGSTLGHSTGQSSGTSTNQNISQSINETHGTSQNSSVSRGVNHSQSSGNSYSQNTSTSQGHTVGSSHNTSLSNGTSISHNQGTSQSQGYNQSQSFSMGNSSSVGSTTSTGSTHGTSEGINFSDSYGTSTSSGGSTSTSTSQGTNGGTSSSEGSNSSTSGGGSVSVFGIGGNINHSSGSSSSNTESSGWSESTSQTDSTNWGTSSSNSHSTGGSSTVSDSVSQTDSNSITDSVSYNSGQSYGTSQSYGTNESWGTSQSQTISEGWGTNVSDSVTNSYGESVGISNSESYGESLSYSQGQGTSHSVGNGYSFSSGSGQSFGTNFSDSMSNSQSLSDSQSVSNSQSFSQSQSVSHSQSLGQSSSVSKSETIGESIGQSAGESIGDSESYGYGESSSRSQTVSNGSSYSTSNSRNTGTAIGQSGTVSSGTSSSMGLGPSIGWNKSYQWLDQGVKDLLELLEYQNERIKRALRGNGAFYTYTYIACPSLKAMNTAQAVAKSTWQNEDAFVQPLQVLDLNETEQKHLLYHFNAFSADVTREEVYGSEEYKYCTVLLSDEYVAYTHLPRVNMGGIETIAEDIPKFAVPAGMNGEVYMGTVLNPDVYTCDRGYRTYHDYCINEERLMHGYVTGASRSGKTVTAMRFIAELSNVRRKRTGKRLRIVVLDPKQDWRALARFVEPERFNFYSLGNVKFRPIQINVWKIPKGVQPQIWIDGVIDIYCRAYGLLERGKQMIADIVYGLYQEAGVFEACNQEDWQDTVPELSRYVNFKKIYQKFESERDKLIGANKGGNDTKDAYARLLERLSCFSRDFSIESRLYGSSDGIGIDELIGDDEVTILESKGLENTFKNFIFGVVVSGFYKYALAHDGGFLAEDQYETVLVIEEANEVLTGNDTAGGNKQLSLSGESEFEQVLDQSAGYGLFIFAITQKISDMPSSVIANAGIVFAGRLVRPDDKSVVIQAIAREERIDNRDIVKWFPRMPQGWFICQSARGTDFKAAEPVLVAIDAINLKPMLNMELDERLIQKEVKYKIEH